MRTLTLIIALIAAPAWAKPPIVVTDIAPVHSLVAQVMGELDQPRLLLDGASDPHHFQMRPSQAHTLSEAELLIWMGPALTPWLERTHKTMAPSARSLSLLDTPKAPSRIEGSDAHVNDSSEHAHGDEHNSLDPHAWLDPLNAAFYLPIIASELAALDPANADVYTANAKMAAGKLETLHATLRPKLEPAKSMTLIATHDAYSYFLARYGLDLSGTLSDSAGNAPGAASIAVLQQDIAAAGKPVCVLQEPGTSAKAIVNLATTTPLKVVELDPMGRAHPAGPDLYAAMIRDLVDAMATCAEAAN